MADDPVTLSHLASFTLREGLKLSVFQMTGPADYDADPGAPCDLSTYYDDIYGVFFGGCDAQADALVIPTFHTTAFGTASSGKVTFSWTGAVVSTALGNVTDTTNLSGYVWQMLVLGTQVAAA